MSTLPNCAMPRWPLRLTALLLTVSALALGKMVGASSIAALILLVALVLTSSVFALLAERMSDGPRLEKLVRSVLTLMRLGALFVVLPEFIASQLPMRWEVLLGLSLPKSECPIYYRLPEVLFDGGRFLKRSGPDSWTGKPLTSVLRMKRSSDVAYLDESDFSVHYDADGFRNPSSMKDWDAVLVGDSFVELGSLPDGETISDQLAVSAGLCVKNLGVASTAPMNHVSYLRHFGDAPSCRHAILVWGEIEVEKTEEEWLRLKAGRSPASAPPTNSLIRALWSFSRKQIHPQRGFRKYANATFVDAENHPIPVMLDPPYPPAPEKLTSAESESIRAALDEWAKTARGMELTPWLVFLPSKIRVSQGRLLGPPELIGWQPNSMPQHVERICREFDIHFVDSTPALRAATQSGLLVFNPVVDGHPTKLGAGIIAKAIAKAMRAQSLGPHQ